MGAAPGVVGRLLSFVELGPSVSSAGLTRSAGAGVCAREARSEAASGRAEAVGTP